MAVSMEGLKLRPDRSKDMLLRSFWRRKQSFANSRSTGTRISSCRAFASHLPDALIHSTLSSFMEVLPLLACVNNRSRPRRADRLSNESMSEDAGFMVFAPGLKLQDSYSF